MIPKINTSDASDIIKNGGVVYIQQREYMALVVTLTINIA
jgi:hypothetical protein